ncbi:MAG: cupin domain-containing protein [Candidatus Heimdallarchaeota archaeon]|nr:cupin domain-containing protein [Candidatus Heimdallarchaeota archaeon]
MSIKKITPQGKNNPKTIQTSGMSREELFTNPDAWTGIVKTDPNTSSGWHHHGDYDTYVYVIAGNVRLDFGQNGKNVIEAGQGDVVFIPKGTIHKESNPNSKEGELFVIRVGSGTPVFNVEGPY